jgi:hypothetical protein
MGREKGYNNKENKIKRTDWYQEMVSIRGKYMQRGENNKGKKDGRRLPKRKC